jgi:Transposase IS116/IS110/IS902 family
MHRRWLAGLRFEHAVHHIVLEDCIAAVEAAAARRDRLEAHIAAALPDWSLATLVHALQALRGMALVAAATLVAELGDITRFANPRQLMAYLGPVPSEHSSGGRDAKAVSQRPVTVRLGGSSSRPPGAIGSRRGSAASSYCGRKVWPSRSAIPHGRHRNDCAGGIASWRGRASHRPWSPPRSPASWQASSGESRDKRRSPPAPDALILTEHEPRRSHRTNTYPKLGKAGGMVTARRTLVSTTSRISSVAGR